MRQNFRRVSVPPQARQTMTSKTLPAPTRGWVSNENLLATVNPAAQGVIAGGAYMLENWFPTSNGIRIRGGARKRATIGTGPVRSLFTYSGGAVERLFASSNTAIYEVTSVGSPTVPPAASVSSLTTGHFSTTHAVNASGNIVLYAVNGTDDPLTFNGTTWTAMNASSTPALTGATGLSAVWKYRNRLFFAQSGSLDVYYLAINSIGGVLTKLPLAQSFKRGGAILFGATWSLDAGDGIDDKCVFVTTEGEFAVYQGGDPSSINDWSIVGRYDIAKPLGKNAFLSIGGDLLVMTQDGIVPISVAVNKDPAELSLSSVTRAIEPNWRSDVSQHSTLPWEVARWTAKGMLIVAVPATAGQSPHCLVANLQTGAWARYTWDARCVTVFGGWAHFGTSDGRVMQCELGSEDDGSSYVCTAVLAFDHLNSPGYQKQIHMGRTVFLAGRPFTPRLSVSTDYQVNLPAAPNSGASGGAAALWDVGLWDGALWDGASLAERSVKTQWESIGASGFAVAAQVQVTCEGQSTPDAELIGIDLTYEIGALVI